MFFFYKTAKIYQFLVVTHYIFLKISSDDLLMIRMILLTNTPSWLGRIVRSYCRKTDRGESIHINLMFKLQKGNIISFINLISVLVRENSLNIHSARTLVSKLNF